MISTFPNTKYSKCIYNNKSTIKINMIIIYLYLTTICSSSLNSYRPHLYQRKGCQIPHHIKQKWPNTPPHQTKVARSPTTSNKSGPIPHNIKQKWPNTPPLQTKVAQSPTTSKKMAQFSTTSNKICQIPTSNKSGQITYAFKSKVTRNTDRHHCFKSSNIHRSW